ncbi:LOW QUALITY PROTEIN: olfactory receptor 52N1-like [Erethizon dorsatum]
MKNVTFPSTGHYTWFQRTRLTPASFILSGIPGLEVAHIWISLPFCSMYLATVLANCGILYLSHLEESLPRLMYYFLALLSFTDIVQCTSIVLKMLCIFRFNLKEISFTGCLVQIFFLHTFTGMESWVLMLMALDCYVAICYPLHYATILTNSVITKAGFLPFLRGMILIIPFTLLTKCLPYCKGNIISHTYCDYMPVAKLSCGNVKVDAISGLMVALLTGGFDILCITVSYTMILWAVGSLSSAEAQQKALSTCTAHICAMVITYIPAFFTFFTHQFGSHTIPHSVHIFVANVYLLLPPTLNPIVYGIKTKQIQEEVIKLFLNKRSLKKETKVNPNVMRGKYFHS